MKKSHSIIIAFSIAFVMVFAGCGTAPQEQEHEGPAHCHLGLASLFDAQGDIEIAKATFNKYFDQTPRIGKVEDDLALMGHVKNETYEINRVRTGEMDFDAYWDNGWYIGMRVETKNGHSIYIDDAYPTEDQNVWHVEVTQTMGGWEPLSFNIMKDQDGKWSVASGIYNGLRITYFVAYTPILED